MESALVVSLVFQLVAWMGFLVAQKMAVSKVGKMVEMKDIVMAEVSVVLMVFSTVDMWGLLKVEWMAIALAGRLGFTKVPWMDSLWEMKRELRWDNE